MSCVTYSSQENVQASDLSFHLTGSIVPCHNDPPNGTDSEAHFTMAVWVLVGKDLNDGVSSRVQAGLSSQKSSAGSPSPDCQRTLPRAHRVTEDS